MADSSQSLRNFWSINLHWRDGSHDPSLLSQCTKRSEDYVVLDDSPTIVNWNGLDLTEQAEITPTLDTANNWIIFTHPLGTEDTATPTPPIPKGAQRILYTKGKAGRERGWWRTGTDKLASYGLDTDVWISQNSTISDSNIIALEALLQTKSEKDLLYMRSEGVEPIYWAGTESGLMDIYNFPGVIYATDDSKGSTGMGAGLTGTIPKEGGDAGLGEATVAARPAGPNLRQHVWLLKIPSPTTKPLRFSRIPKDS